jgi:hypothetical protein
MQQQDSLQQMKVQTSEKSVNRKKISTKINFKLNLKAFHPKYANKFSVNGLLGHSVAFFQLALLYCKTITKYI